MVTELITGESLLAFLKSKKVEFQTHQKGHYENQHFGLNDLQLLNIALQIALGMQHLHERKVCRLALNNSNSKNSRDNYLAKPTKGGKLFNAMKTPKITAVLPFIIYLFFYLFKTVRT